MAFYINLLKISFLIGTWRYLYLIKSNKMTEYIFIITLYLFWTEYDLKVFMKVYYIALLKTVTWILLMSLKTLIFKTIIIRYYN